ncbi:MAG: bacteriohemerythrin [Magnetococcales bacterium]|nr:bacteriohemerythrin [Magnetococcales bacterium]
MDLTSLLMQEYLTQATGRGILLVGMDGSIAFVNDRFFEWTGCANQSIQGERFDRFLAQLPEQPGWRGPKRTLFLAQIVPILARTEHWVELPFQVDLWLRLIGRPMASGGYVLTVTDVTALHQTAINIRRANNNMVKSLADIAENRDNNTGEHVLRVAILTHAIAQDLQERGLFPNCLTPTFLAQVGYASMLHDVGKVTVPDAVLLKPGRLTAEEREIMQQHALAGFRMVKKIQDLQENSAYFDIAEAIALSHHEQYAGGGYPHGIRDEAIPLEARIVGVADVFDALTSWRPYKEPWPDTQALEFIDQNAGIMFDPLVVQALHRVLVCRRQHGLVQWVPSMSIGHDEIDKDHHTLIDLINQLAVAQQRLDTIMMDFVLEELYNYTVRHFHREEVYMRKWGYPQADRHQQIHQEFTEWVVGLRRRFLRHPDPEMAVDLLTHLGSWLTEHIQKVDRDYQSFLPAI